MTIKEQIAKEMIEWNLKLTKGYKPSEIEQSYLNGLRKTYTAMLEGKLG